MADIGTLVVSLVLMVIYWAIRPAFFRGETLHKETPIMVMDPEVTGLAPVGVPPVVEVAP